MKPPFEGIRLRNDHWDLAVIPATGCRISGMRALGSGREWLWRNSHLAMGLPVYGDSYIATMDAGGWDEIFPSVSPDMVEGLAIPDHGDLVALPWTVMNADERMLHAFVETRFAECRFERRIGLDGDAIRINYQLVNLGHREVPYLWCAHPLFAIQEGMRIVLPAGTPMRVAWSSGLVDSGDFAWPGDHLDVVPDPGCCGFRPFAAKLFAARLNRVMLVAPDGVDAVEIAWDGSFAPYLGLWLNYGEWSGSGSPPYFNLGIEPATAPADSLSLALNQGSAQRLKSLETVDWSLSVRSVSVG